MRLELDYQAWMDDALCAQVGAGPFFPEKGESARAAKRICAGCPVREACLQYALGDNILEGVWGGTTEKDRRQLKPRPKHGPICTVDGCDNEHHSHGLCNKHAIKARRTAA